ncbi:hypothetical protein, partial [Streptosporangium sp. NPDC049078]|uniref:hypothetical protein n=1 Tax=Streptosporangium sp. NPDC049078 TaxID=3155767 RepID=UPI00342D470B
MIWETDDYAHAGWAAAEFSDGRVSVGSEAGGAVGRVLEVGDVPGWPSGEVAGGQPDGEVAGDVV